MVIVTTLRLGMSKAVLLACVLFCCATASAQPVGQEEPIAFALEPAPVGATLRELARQAKVQIIFSPRLMSGLEAPAIKGEYPVLEAVQLVLDGTDLTASFVTGDLIAIKPARVVGLEGAPGLAANAGPSLTRQVGGARSANADRRAIISGRVVSAYAGAPLAGAVVSVDEYNLSTVAGEDGEFRLEGAPPGEYVLRVSYFGLPETTTVVANSSEAADIIIKVGGRTTDVIVVTGVRSANDNSVNRQRSSSNIVSILASDLSGQYPDDTIAEALRRAPGLSFERAERGGEGEFVSIRGVDAAFNLVTINGQETPLININGDRRVPLDSFQADGISQIVVHKTLLPHQPSVGLGGVVDIITAPPAESALTRNSLIAEARYSEFNKRAGFLVGGKYGTHFGANDELGVFVSGVFRRRYLRTYQLDVLGAVLPDQLPVGVGGTPIDNLDGLTGMRLNAASLGRIEDMRFNVFDDRRDIFSMSAGLSARLAEHTRLFGSVTVNTRAIDTTRSALGFEQKEGFTDRNVETGDLIDAAGGAFHFFGNRPFARWRTEVEDEDREMLAASFAAETALLDLNVRYGAGFSKGRTELPLATQIDFKADDLDLASPPALPVDAPTGRRFIAFDISEPLLPAPAFTDEGFALFDAPDRFRFDDIRVQTRRADDRQFSAFLNFDAPVDIGALKDVKWGFHYGNRLYENFDTRRFLESDVGVDGAFDGDNDFFLSDTNLLGNGIIEIGLVDGLLPGLSDLRQTNRAGVLSFRDRLLQSAADDVSSFEQEWIHAREWALAGYLSARLELNRDLYLEGGVRLERFEANYRNSSVVTVENSVAEVTDRTASPWRNQVAFEVMPRIALVYRPNDTVLVKASVFESLARPSFDQLAAPLEIDIDLDASEAFIETGDAQSENIRARSYDLSFQYFGKDIGFFELNAYFKEIKNIGFAPEVVAGSVADLESFSPVSLDSLGVDVNAIDSVIITRPFYAADARAYGADLSYLYNFDQAPAPWHGFGVRLSGSIQHTNFVYDNGFESPRNSEFENAPRFAGTAGLWYKTRGFSAYAVYSHQGSQLNSLEWTFPDEFVQPYSALDIRAEYSFGERDGKNYILYLAASDVLDGGRKPTTHETIGRSDRLLDDIEFNGREIRLGVEARF